MTDAGRGAEAKMQNRLSGTHNKNTRTKPFDAEKVPRLLICRADSSNGKKQTTMKIDSRERRTKLWL